MQYIDRRLFMQVCLFGIYLFDFRLFSKYFFMTNKMDKNVKEKKAYIKYLKL